VSRRNNKWTPELLAQFQQLYEAGTSNQSLAAMFDLKPATVSVMAWQRGWERERRREPATPTLEQPAAHAVFHTAADINPPIPPTRDEVAFNARLCRTINAYWRRQGRAIDTRVQTLGCGLQAIRSRSRNGLPVD
jgi:hypothetical protein